MALDPVIMQRLRARYLSSLPQKIEHLERLGTQAEEGEEGADEQLRALAHQLGGNGGSFGWPEISEAGHRLEHAEPSQRAQALQALVRTLEAVQAAGAT